MLEILEAGFWKIVVNARTPSRKKVLFKGYSNAVVTVDSFVALIKTL